eukprot:1195648-Prorocentrum_minimum.AAC.2
MASTTAEKKSSPPSRPAASWLSAPSHQSAPPSHAARAARWRSTAPPASCRSRWAAWRAARRGAR